MNIGQRIKARREALQITQKELASRVGYVSKSTINKIESGINDIPQSKVIAFAEALETTIAFLMGWDTSSGFGKEDAPAFSLKDERDREVYELLSQLSSEQLERARGFLESLRSEDRE